MGRCYRRRRLTASSQPLRPPLFKGEILRRSLLLALALAGAGCVQISTARVGDRFAPKPDDCVLEYRYGDMTKLLSSSDR